DARAFYVDNWLWDTYQALEPLHMRSEEHTSDLQSLTNLVCRLLLEKKPMVDARLADGSRVNISMPPLAVDRRIVSIRRFGTTPLTASFFLNYRETTQHNLLSLQKALPT